MFNTIYDTSTSWALAIFRNQDYSDADIPMYPVKHGIKNTFMMNIYTFLMVSSVNSLYFLNTRE